MVAFYSEISFDLLNANEVSRWIIKTIEEEGKSVGEINYIFCDDEYLYKINLDFLKHDTYTDIITFDNSLGNQVFGEIYISIDRVKDNSKEFTTEFSNELQRVMIHGILHLCGYRDKTQEEINTMRAKEDYYIAKAPDLSF